MKLVFAGAESPVELSGSYVRTLEIENRTLFCRLCRSLLSGAGEDALEPYSVWDGDGLEIAPKNALLVIDSPLVLPWDNKALSGHLFDVVERLLFEDEEARMEIEAMGSRLSTALLRLTHQVDADYGFGVEWEIKRYLKAFSFTAERSEDASYLDNLIAFLDFASDMGLKQALVFVNLKTFLNENDTKAVFDRAIFHGLSLLLLESHIDDAYYDSERKTLIDQHFLWR